MDDFRGTDRSATQSISVEDGILRTAQIPCETEHPVSCLQDLLGDQEYELILLFVSPDVSFERIVSEACLVFAKTQVIACSTAGEIGRDGYCDGNVVAVGFPAKDFSSRCLMIEEIDRVPPELVIDKIALERIALQDETKDMKSGFAFLAIDGLSLSEDRLTAKISPALRDMPLFGGSAGDGTEFRNTKVALNGQVAENAAVLSLLRCRHRTEVFSLDHLVPTEVRMVVTEADPDRRIVKSINAEPAAREYARIVGKDPDQLDRFTFASHPVAVRIGDKHHVRAIQQVNDAGELVFFSAIDEGMVLTVAEPQNMAEHLNKKLGEMSAVSKPTNFLVCDCLLRRIEAEQMQLNREVSNILSGFNVTGFSTYGEQIGSLHVNHTMTGVAFYPCDKD